MGINVPLGEAKSLKQPFMSKLLARVIVTVFHVIPAGIARTIGTAHPQVPGPLMPQGAATLRTGGMRPTLRPTFWHHADDFEAIAWDKEMPLSTADLLALSTVRIECPIVGGVSTGSGFYYGMLEDGQQHVPVIVTNKHVIRGMPEGRLHMTRLGDDGQPLIGQHVVVTIPNFEQQWILHPSDDVDLCVMPIGGVLEQLRTAGQAVFVQRFGRDLIPNAEHLEDLGALQQITMIGYPNGLWDSVNNMPLMRQGVCATHPGRDYLGRKEFVIDAACYPGSSGSPVVVFNQGMWQSRQGANIGGERLMLLGLLYAGPQITATGEVTVQTVPTTNRVLANVPTMMHLGYVIKSERLLEMEDVVRAELARRDALPERPIGQA